jgi:hypothetical protein
MRALLLLIPLPAMAADNEAAIRRTFIHPWAQALLTHDPAKVKPFLHPSVLACWNAETRPYFDFILKTEARDQIKGRYEVTRIEPMKEPAPTFLPPEGFSFPVEPTYEINVQFGDLTMIRFLAPSMDHGTKYIPVPTKKGCALCAKK